MKPLFILLTVSLYATPVMAQDPAEDSHLEYLADELMGYPGDDANYEERYENLLQVLSSPFDLNRISREDLQYLHILNDAQINAFLDYRNNQGALLDIHELQVIPG